MNNAKNTTKIHKKNNKKLTTFRRTKMFLYQMEFKKKKKIMK
jgi:hypothetical protein